MSGGITVEVPDPAPGEWSEPFKLPRSGKMARLREPSVGDLLAAQRTVGKDAPDGAEAVALAAGMVEVDGKIVPYEALRMLKLGDYSAIMRRASKLGFLPEPDSTDAP